jgi:hypothetical protein
MRDSQWPRFGNVAKRVAANILVGGGIGEFADAHAIQNNPKHALESRHNWTPPASFAETLSQRAFRGSFQTETVPGEGPLG